MVSEVYWQTVMSSGMAVPEDRTLSEATVELVQLLGSPNPRVREDVAYPLLSTWIGQGVYDDLLGGLGDGLLPGLRTGLGHDGDPSVLRRSYSALVLAEVLGRDESEHLLPRTTVLTWGDQVAGWFVRENDHRGWLGDQGWAHAIAHGADLVAALARSRHLGTLELTVLLDVVGDRLLAPTPYAWRHGEDDRLAFAVMTMLHRDVLDAPLLEAWLNRLGAGLVHPPTRGHQDREWPSPAARNTSAFLRALYLQLALGVQGRSDLRSDAHLFARPPRHRADLLLAVLEQLRAENPWLYREPAKTPRIGPTSG